MGRDLPFNDSLNPPILEKFQDSETRKVFDKLLSENKNLKNSLLVKKLKENNVYPVSEALEIPDDAYRDGAVAKLGVKRLREFKQSKEKFLMVLGFNKPHLPFNAPKKYWDLHTPSKFQLAPYAKQDNKRPKYAYHSYGELGAYTGFEIGGAVSEEQQRHLIHAYYACVSYVDAQVGKVLKELKSLT